MTLVPVSSSWIVEDGISRLAGDGAAARRADRRKGYMSPARVEIRKRIAARGTTMTEHEIAARRSRRVPR